jgi:signal transduction histidine kinase
VALLGLGLSVVLAVLLGVGIPSSVERSLRNAHMETIVTVVEDLAGDDLIRASDGSVPDLVALGDAIDERFIEIDVVRVKVWDVGGTVVYSDLAEIVGQTFPISDDLAEAFRGDAHAGHAETTSDAHVAERSLGHLWEFHVPVVDQSGEVTAVFEVYEISATFHAYLASIRRWVWWGVGLGLAILFVFNVALVAANSRALNRRREQAERLLIDLARAQEEERTRIIGALHDDIGQPLYRVLYGIQGSRSQVASESPVAAELDRVAELVRWIDGTLRSELGRLHQGAMDRQDLDALLTRLVDDVRSESSIDVTLKLGTHDSLSDASRTALFRAAREAVTNARKHAAATSVAITVTRGSHRILLDVEDNGTGFLGETGLGLATTRSRLEAIGGGLRVVRRDTGGTLFRAWVPDEPGVEQ